MKEALVEAERAFAMGEVPVGAVVVKDGDIIARGCNCRETDRVATAHAELLAMEEACRALGTWRLSDCTLYVTRCAPAPPSTRALGVSYTVPRTPRRARWVAFFRSMPIPSIIRWP